MSADSNKRILVVDDNVSIHRDFEKIFKSQSQSGRVADEMAAELLGEPPGAEAEAGPDREPPAFDLSFASQGQEALEMVRQARREGRPYAMAFMDVRMPPGWDGIETTSRIWECDPDLQVAICTAFSDYNLPQITEKLKKPERFVILKKPFDTIEVLQMANAFTEKWVFLKEIEENRLELERRVHERTLELKKTRAQLERLLHSSPAIIYCLQLAGEERITFLSENIRTALGHSPGELMDDPGFWTGQAHPDDVARIHSHRLRAVMKGNHSEEYRLRHRDGTYRWVHDEARVIHVENGAASEIAGYFIDITALKQAEQERRAMELHMQQSQKLEAIGRLAAGVAHEINTPIQYVADNIRFLRDSLDGIVPVLRLAQTLAAAIKEGGAAPEMIEGAEKTLAQGDLDYLCEQIPVAMQESTEGVQRIAKIVQAMKEFSHPSNARKTSTDINRAIESTATVARNEWRYVAEMKLDLDPHLPVIPCIAGEFNQAILNLIVNAAHSIADVVRLKPETRGTITIRTRRDGGHVEVRVEDTGAGIPEAIRPRIFEPFFTTKGVGVGTGQGLNMVYGCVVKKHAGTVRFESEVGRGTDFILRLPVDPSPEEEPSAAMAGHAGN